jgi:hypothetical protein
LLTIGLPVLLMRKAGSRPSSYPRVEMLLLGLAGGYRSIPGFMHTRFCVILPLLIIERQFTCSVASGYRSRPPRRARAPRAWPGLVRFKMLYVA